MMVPHVFTNDGSSRGSPLEIVPCKSLPRHPPSSGPRKTPIDRADESGSLG